MLNRIFPRQIDNRHRGHWLAIWLLVAIVAMRSAIGANSMLNPRLVATSADGIPLASFDPGGAQAVVALFALLGLFQLLLAFLGVVALIRYRAMIPLIYLLLLIHLLGLRVLRLAHPIAASGASGGQIGSAIGLALLAITLAGFVLSLLGRGPLAAAAPDANARKEPA